MAFNFSFPPLPPQKLRYNISGYSDLGGPDRDRGGLLREGLGLVRRGASSIGLEVLRVVNENACAFCVYACVFVRTCPGQV